MRRLWGTQVGGEKVPGRTQVGGEDEKVPVGAQVGGGDEKVLGGHK